MTFRAAVEMLDWVQTHTACRTKTKKLMGDLSGPMLRLLLQQTYYSLVMRTFSLTVKMKTDFMRTEQETKIMFSFEKRKIKNH